MDLNVNFLNELFRSCLFHEEILKLCVIHLKYSFLPDQYYKEVWKYIKSHYQTQEKAPTKGFLYQAFSTDKNSLGVVGDIFNADIVDKDIMLQQFQTYITRGRVLDLYDQFGELYSAGSRDDAVELIINSMGKIKDISIHAEVSTPLFGGFEKRNERRLGTSLDTSQICYLGIDPLDQVCGGMFPGQLSIVLGRSGMGKSRYLRHIGIQNAKMGKRVLHIQAEGTERDTLAFYDSAWTAQNSFWGIDPDLPVYQKLKKVTQQIQGEIFVESIEEFGKAGLNYVESKVQAHVNKYDRIDVLILDYLELFSPDDGKKYAISEERHRRLALAERIKNMLIKYKMVGHTATQASTVSTLEKSDPKFVMDEEHIAECKGLSQPTTLFVSLNQTQKEYHEDLMRLYVMKSRFSKGKQVLPIVTNFKNGRFINRVKTRKLYEDE